MLKLSISLVVIVLYPITSFCQIQECGEVYIIAEEQPTFDGGLQEFYSLISERIKMNVLINSSLDIEYVVTKSGKISSVRVNGMKEEAKNEVIEFLENLNGWQPGKIAGEAVCVKMILPIRYRP